MKDIELSELRAQQVIREEALEHAPPGAVVQLALLPDVSWLALVERGVEAMPVARMSSAIPGAS